MKRFFLQRHQDITGISGTGKVAEGCILHSGKVVMSWLSATPSGCVHESIEAVQKIHGHSGATEIVFPEDDDLSALPTLYHLHHSENKSGLSGVGDVAEIVLFSNNWTALQWLVEPFQIEFYSQMDHCCAVHASQTHAKIIPHF